MDDRRVEEFEREALRSRMELDRGMARYWDAPPKDAIDRIDPERAVRCLLRVNLADAEEIDPAEGGDRHGNLPLRMGARLDREKNEIAVARRFRRETRRYTLARAIAYWKLSDGWSRLQLPPAVAGHRPGSTKPAGECEADLFADEFLMPACLVRTYFRQLFGVESLRELAMTEVLARWLGSGREGRSYGADVVGRGRENLSLLAASWVPDGRELPSLAARFGVSSLAMAIRLEKLRLV